MCANDDEDSDLAYATILDAAARGDVDSLVRFLPERPDRIKLNVARKSLQIMSCSGGSLIANVPLDNVAFGLARSGLALAEAAEVVEAPELQRF